MKRLFGDWIVATRNADMPSDVNDKSTQDRLVEAAERLFSERGFNETSVRDIASAADCNVASINYYFGGKDNLYKEIWRRRLAQMREIRLASIERVMSRPEPPSLEDLLRSFGHSFVEPLAEGGERCRFINLMAREMIDPHLPTGMFVSELVLPSMTAFRKALLTICPWLDESRIHLITLSVVGQIMHTMCVGRMFEHAENQEVPPLDVKQLVDHVVRFSAAGIRGYADDAKGHGT